jgi:hypothetical protein
MLKQLEEDTKRGLDPREIASLIGVDSTTHDDVKEFFKGFRGALDESRDWLADELLEIKRGLRGGGVSEALHEGGKQATKPGKHGTLRLWRITYKDTDNPAFGENSYQRWAYDKDGAWDDFNEEVNSAGESWEIVKIESVLDTGPKRLSREARSGGVSEAAQGSSIDPKSILKVGDEIIAYCDPMWRSAILSGTVKSIGRVNVKISLSVRFAPDGPWHHQEHTVPIDAICGIVRGGEVLLDLRKKRGSDQGGGVLEETRRSRRHPQRRGGMREASRSGTAKIEWVSNGYDAGSHASVGQYFLKTMPVGGDRFIWSVSKGTKIIAGSEAVELTWHGGYKGDPSEHGARVAAELAMTLHKTRSSRTAAVSESRRGPTPVEDPEYVIQGAYSDGRIMESFGFDDEDTARSEAWKLSKSPYFEGDHVRIITRDGELVWDSRGRGVSEARRPKARRPVRRRR